APRRGRRGCGSLRSRRSGGSRTPARRSPASRSCGASLAGPDDLDALALVKLAGRPAAARDDLLIEGDRHPPEVAHAGGGQDVEQRRPGAGDLDGGAVHGQQHARANRSGRKGAMASGTTPSQTTDAMASAVTGVSRMPLRWWPVATTRPAAPHPSDRGPNGGSDRGPSRGALSRLPGRRPAEASASLISRT